VTQERTVKKVFKSIPDENSSVGKPRKRWLGNIDNDQKKMGVRGCRKIACDSDVWKLALKEVRILHRPYKQWRRELRAVKMGKWGTGSTRSIFRA
jgi:hypothetical protein